MTELIILKNTIEKNKLKNTYKNIIKYINDDTIIGLKVSPIDFTSKISTFIYTKVCNAYCFSSIRGCFIYKSKNSLNIYDIIYNILKDYNPIIRITQSSQKNWYIVYINEYPSIVYKYDKNLTYSFFIPGTADRPLEDKNNINYILTMSFPTFEKSFYFNADHVLNIIVNNIKKIYNIPVKYIDNIEYKLYKSFLLNKNLNNAIKYYNDNKIPFNNFIIDIISKNNHIININHTKNFKLKFSHKKSKLLSYPVNKGDLVRIIYNINAKKINSTKSCHDLAYRISTLFDNTFKVSSYYQKGFDIKNNEFDKYNTLSYGHNTLLEKLLIAKSSIHIYYKNILYNIQIYDKGMFMIIGSATSEVSINNTKYIGLDILNMITNELIKDL